MMQPFSGAVAPGILLHQAQARRLITRSKTSAAFMLTLKQAAHENLEMRPGLRPQSYKVQHHQGASGFGIPCWEVLLGHSPWILKLIQNA